MAPKSNLWNLENELKLIDYFEPKRCMWNPRDTHYFKTEHKNTIYKKCAHMLGPGFTVAMVKKRWSNIRGTFVINHKKTKCKSSDEVEDMSNHMPTWNLYNRLLFLIPSVATRKKSNIIDEVSKLNTSQETREWKHVLVESIVCEPVLDSEELEDHLPNTKRAAPKRVPARKDDDDRQGHSRRRRSVATLPPGENQEITDKTFGISSEMDSGTANSRDKLDMHDHFGCIVAEATRTTMSDVDVRLAYIEIQQVLLKYHRENRNK